MEDLLQSLWQSALHYLGLELHPIGRVAGPAAPDR